MVKEFIYSQLTQQMVSLDFSVPSIFDIITFIKSDNIKYGVIGLGVMAGFVLHLFPIYAKKNIGNMFVSVCFNFTPFLSQCTAFLLGVQQMPGTFTVLGGASLFVGCTMLSMDLQNQKEVVNLPLIGKIEAEDTDDTLQS